MISLKLWPGGFANFRVYIAKLNLDQLSRIHHPDGSDQPATIFDHLVLPSSHKEMLQALVHSHFRAKNQRVMGIEGPQDIVRGKGKSNSWPTSRLSSLHVPCACSTCLLKIGLRERVDYSPLGTPRRGENHHCRLVLVE